MAIRTCELGEDYGQISVRNNPPFRRIVHNQSPGKNEELVILFDNVKCMQEGEGVLRLRYTKTVRGLRLQVWEKDRRIEMTRLFAILPRGRSWSHCWNIFQQW